MLYLATLQESCNATCTLFNRNTPFQKRRYLPLLLTSLCSPLILNPNPLLNGCAAAAQLYLIGKCLSVTTTYTNTDGRDKPGTPNLSEGKVFICKESAKEINLDKYIFRKENIIKVTAKDIPCLLLQSLLQ